MDDDYYIDVYHAPNPYDLNIRHLERIQFSDIQDMQRHLDYVEAKYQALFQSYEDYIVTMCKGKYSANRALESAIAKLTRKPEKQEIN